MDMASAFATFAADGVYRPPFIVAKVETADGRVLYEHEQAPGEQRIPQQVARNVTESMLDVAKVANFALADGRVAATKTGTVQQGDTGSDNKDAWTVGYTPSIATAVWIGTDTSEAIRDSRNRPIYGRMLPGQIWQEFMNSALEGSPKEQFSRFVPMGEPPIAEGTTQQQSGSTAPSGTPQSGSQDGSGDNSGNSDSNNGNGNSSNNGNGNGNGSGSGSGSNGNGNSSDNNADSLLPGSSNQRGGGGSNSNNSGTPSTTGTGGSGGSSGSTPSG
jgi:membrane peptidoglycan carboxypeptidase